jgi:membrane-bound lytic murein transglycosylase MltF
MRSLESSHVGVLLLFLSLGLVNCSGADESSNAETGSTNGSTVAAGLGPGKAAAAATEEELSDVDSNELLDRARQPFFGDLPEIRERRFLRVLVSYGKTNFFYGDGRARGFEVEMFNKYAEFLNKGDKSPLEKVRIVFVPTPFDRLLSDLQDGKGDVAAAGLTATADRREKVAFTRPYLSNVREIVVTNGAVDDLNATEDLAGRDVVVRAGSSYSAHLHALNGRFGADEVRVIEADSRLATEDLLEMVSSGAIAVSVADEHIAQAWAEVLPGLGVRADLEIHSGGEIGWAVRKDARELLANLDQFVAQHKKGSLLGNILFKRYYQNSRWIQNPLAGTERAKLEGKILLFQKYGEQYGFDWLALAAQAYQESGLDQSKTSGAGAVGVMQIKPSTAGDKSVGISDIHILENNIHAGTKYLAFLRDRYFDDPAIEPAAQVDFAWAAYNAGPARVRRLRQKAADQGFDANRWFNNVEKIAAEEIGRETVDYVANINKYYLAYKLQYESYRQRQAAKSGA